MQARRILLLSACLLLWGASRGFSSSLIHYWGFNDTNQLLTPTYTLGGASLQVDTGTVSEVTFDTGQDFFGENNRMGEDTGFHLRLNDPLGATVIFQLPTTGYEHPVFRYETRRSGRGAGTQILAYTTNGTTWAPLGVVTNDNAPPVLHTFDLAGMAGVHDNPDFAVRITFEQGAGDTEGNNRFDNVSLDGYAMAGINRPPAVENAPDFVAAVEDGDPVMLDLNDVFNDPDDDPLMFSAVIARTNIATHSISNGMLELDGLLRGETEVTVSANDGHNPSVFVTFRLLVYPRAHVLENGPFLFGEWDPDTPELTYPEHMLFLQSDRDDTEIDTPLVHAYHLEPEDYHDDDETIGQPYNNTRRTRINGLGEEGIAFINTGQDRDLGGALLALDTRNVTDAPVGWLAGTVLANARVYAIRLQYRLGTTGDFIDVLDESEQAVEYIRVSDGHIQPMDPVTLPEAAMGEAYVQVLWRYYWTDPEGVTGARAQLRLDDIVVANTLAEPATALAFVDQPHAFWQSGRTLEPFSVRAMDSNGLTDTDFEGTITLDVIGDSGLSGDLAAQAVSGVATFTNVVLTGTGTNRLEATSDPLDPALSSLVSIADITGLIVPAYIQGGQDAFGNNNDRIPFAYRAKIDGLLPNATYRYGNRVIDSDDPWDQNGAGNMIFVTGSETNWIRNTDAPRFRATDYGSRHYEFTTDGEGSYTGWFITEPTGNERFTPGNTVWMRILLNDGQGGEDEQHTLTLSEEIAVIRFGEAAGEATGIMGESAEPDRNFVFLYNNTDGTNRPLAGVPVEITGSEVDDRYAAFYEQVVATTPEFWGTLIPNTLPTGVRRIEYRALADGGVPDAQTFAEGIPVTVNPIRGLNALYLDADDEGIPVFLPGGTGTWTVDWSWSTGMYPDGVDAAAVIRAPRDGDRDVELFAPATIGHLAVDHEASDHMNGISGRGAGSILTFHSSNEPAQLTIEGSGSGFVEFRTEASFVLNSDLLITITNVHENHGQEGVFENDYGALRLRDAWTGAGGLIKDGAGVMSMTGGGKDYTGATIVEFGVLRVTEPAAPRFTSGVTVNPGGQLRLVSTDDRVYPFGGTITLNSLGRGGDVPGEATGILGALRYDPGSNDNRAEVTNAVVIAGPTSLHVDRTRNVMDLSGTLSGPGAFSKSGGGTLVLSGDSSEYANEVIVSNGILRVDGALGSEISVRTDGEVSGNGTVGALSGAGTVWPGPGMETLTAPSVNGLSYRFVLAHGSGDMLRLTGESPFVADLNMANAIGIFLDVQELAANDVFDGGFFTDEAGDFMGSISNATWTFYVRDEEGEVEHDGVAYTVYGGPVDLKPRTVRAVRDFGDGPVEGRLLRVGARPEGPEPVAAWVDDHFSAEETMDPHISGPHADPDDSGIQNLVRYALGLGRHDSYEGMLPGARMDEDPIFRHRRLIAGNPGVDYLIEVSADLGSGGWDGAVMNTDLIEWSVTPTGDGITEMMEYRVLRAGLVAPKYFRLRVILLD